MPTFHTSFSRFLAVLATLACPTSAIDLGLTSPPLHVVIAVDMTGSSKNPAFGYTQQARLIAQNVLLNQVRSGDTVTLLHICGGVKTIADFQYQSASKALMPKADILRYASAVTAPCKGKGSAITAGFETALKAGQRTKAAKAVIVYFTDGALLDDPQRANLPALFGKLLGRNTASVFIAGLSPETDAAGGSIRDSFTEQLGKAADDGRVILAGAYDLANVYPSFAAAVKEARK
ncbi:VWA domain-containing protein [Deinococcus sp.]|uniref:VWA domain-containing protein n=1 Tax=Deinococcus sp. TaxID=47478 RepID=UPI003B5C2DEA